MGEIAARLADRVLITSDNPRSEDPLAIISQIEKGVRERHEVEADRARAIDKAISSCGQKDVILIAGKGHETTQEVAGRRLDFSDEEHARAALSRREKAGRAG
jgi:UDP-N-acetylmuramoyl-L-alanyl-D-glutamate--2,6-diaminopimelate ligase